jgi:hypothetical protein
VFVAKLTAVFVEDTRHEEGRHRVGLLESVHEPEASA